MMRAIIIALTLSACLPDSDAPIPAHENQAITFMHMFSKDADCTSTYLGHTIDTALCKLTVGDHPAIYRCAAGPIMLPECVVVANLGTGKH